MVKTIEADCPVCGATLEISVDSGRAAPKRKAAPVESLVRKAYRDLAREQRSPNVLISDLHRATSPVTIADLRQYLMGECFAHRAIPLLGEPTHASATELAAALDVDGQPHLYIRFK